MRSNQSDRDAPRLPVTVKINRFRNRLTTPHSAALATSTTPRTTLRGTERTPAKALRLKIPEPFLLRVDEAIE
jgi:hypothetical protein